MIHGYFEVSKWVIYLLTFIFLHGVEYQPADFLLFGADNGTYFLQENPEILQPSSLWNQPLKHLYSSFFIASNNVSKSWDSGCGLYICHLPLALCQYSLQIF